MTKMVLTKKTFIGHGAAGHLAYPGEEVDVDEKGVPVAAGSTPIGNMTVDQLKAEVARREKAEGKSAAEPNFGDNVAPPSDTNTGEQRLEIAKIRPGDGVNPQGLPPGSVPVGDRFLRPAPDGADAAVEVVVGTGAGEGVVAQTGTFDHDGDGKAGGSSAATPAATSGMNKTQLLDTAKAEGVAVAEGATNAEIRDAIEAKRSDA